MPSSYAVPQMTRCASCTLWWCKTPEIEKCPCGGELALVDMDAHMAKVPRAAVEKPPGK